MRVYVSGPYTKGDVAQNVKAAIDAAQRLIEAGHSPYVPHLTHFWHMLHPGPYEQWMDLDLEYLKVCEAIVRLPGESKGADIETRKADEWGIPLMDICTLTGDS